VIPVHRAADLNPSLRNRPPRRRRLPSRPSSAASRPFSGRPADCRGRDGALGL